MAEDRHARVIGDVVGEALDTANAAALQKYPKLFDDRYGSHYKLGRLTERLLGRPALARRVHHALGSRPTFAEGALRIATQHHRSGRGGVPELMYRVGRAAATFAPDARRQLSTCSVESRRRSVTTDRARITG
jgi:hypothetical protein